MTTPDLDAIWTKVRATFFEAVPNATKQADIGLSGVQADITVAGVATLIAAVEALRERVAEIEADFKQLDASYEGLNKFAVEEHERAESAEAREAALATAIEQTAEHAKAEREQLEARMVVLEGALDKIAHSGPVDMDGNDDAYAGWSWCYDLAKTTLAATPAEALERAKLGKELIKVSDAVIDSGRRLRSDPGTHELMLASLCCVMRNLAKLDAPGKEGNVNVR